jgi:hypothetical protein
MLQARRSWVQDPKKSLNFFNLPNPTRPWVYSASNRNEYQKQKKKKMFLGSKAQQAHKADNLTTICEPTV